MRVAAFFLSFLFFPLLLFGQVRGHIYDEQSKQPIQQVLLSTADAQVYSDAQGAFSIPARPESSKHVQISLSHLLYQDTTLTVGQAGQLTIYLKPRTFGLTEVTITAESQLSRSGTEAAKLSRKELDNMAKPLGEADLIKAMQLRPGVLQTGETQTGLFVRGGSNAQTAVLLQGTPIFNAAHLLGINSSLDPDAYSSVTLTTGGFTAREGAWLSAYLQSEPRAETVERHQLKLGVGILSSEASYQRQFPGAKTNVYFKAKSSYYQLLAKAYRQLHGASENSNTLPDYAFSDLNLQTFTRFRSGSLSLALFGSQDQYDGTTDRFSLASGWGNRLVSARWKQTLGPGWLELTQGYSRYAFTMQHQRQEQDKVNQETTGSFSTLLLGLPLGKNGYWEAGAFLQHMQAAMQATQQDADSRLLLSDSNREKLTMGGLFSEAQLRLGAFKLTGGGRLYRYDRGFLLAPRLRVQLSESAWALGVYYDRTFQFHHQVNILGVNMPFDFMRLASTEMPVQQSDQVGLSWSRQLQQHRLTGGIYFRWLAGQLFYANGTALLRDFERSFEAHDGRAYGLELEYQASIGQATLTTNYTLAYSQVALANAGGRVEWAYPVQDTRHQINASIGYTFARHWQLTGQWFLQTGSPYTFPTGIIPAQGMSPAVKPRLVPLFEQINNVRTPLRHRLDIGLTRKVQHQKRTSEWSFGIYNAYNQANPYFLYFDVIRQEDGTGQLVAKQRSMLPFTPSLRYTCTFDL